MHGAVRRVRVGRPLAHAGASPAPPKTGLPLVASLSYVLASYIPSCEHQVQGLYHTIMSYEGIIEKSPELMSRLDHRCVESTRPLPGDKLYLTY